jgi:hypothetical protein
MTRLPEAALHRIWEQRDRGTAHLRTTDGRRVTVIHAGTPNPDTGPDFLGAVIRIGASLYRGDVEIHTTAAGWHLHHHHRDPRYNRVILHVAGSGTIRTPPARTASGRSLPLLILPAHEDCLPAIPDERDRIIDACAARLRDSHDPLRTLSRLGWTRIRRKMRRFERRLVQLVAEEHGAIAEPAAPFDPWLFALPPRSGGHIPAAHHWEQLVYEAVMESMGYARNGAAFLLLARTVPLSDLRRGNLRDRDRSMGILFGAAGLLPDPDTRADEEAAAFTNMLRGHWQTWRRACNSGPAPEMSWVFFRLRPASFPTARIAAMAYLLPALLATNRLRDLLREVLDRRTPPTVCVRRIQEALRITPEGFWAHHLHFHDHWKERGVRLGRDRMAIIMLNALLPIGLLHARMTGDRTMARRLRALAQHMPAPCEPRLIRTIREQALGKAGRMRGVQQMGMVELVRNRKEEGRRKKEKTPG